MTTINTIEDLMRVLDSNPELLEAMRARLLTRELLEMPNTLAQFMESTNQKFEQVDKRLEQIDKRFEQVDQRFEQIDRRFDRVESSIQGIRDDLSPLKGAHARNVALVQSDLIAEDMGLAEIRLLAAAEIREMARSLRASGTISRSDYVSFRLADMVIETEDSNSDRVYIAVEVSYTVNGRDTRRALRNAEFLSRITGLPSRAAVSGLHKDDRVQSLIDSREIHWHQLDRSLLEAE